MFIRIVLFLSLSLSIAFSQPSQAEVISAVKSNPALLDTPQAKAQMQKMGISKSDVLTKLNSTNTKSNIKKENVKADNNINSTEEIPVIKEKSLNEIKKEQSNLYINPLEYKDNSKILNDLQKKQSIRKTKQLNRYGLSFFKNKNSINNNTIPVPSYYVLSPGDTVSIWIYGVKNDNYNLKIDNRGNINIPRFGPLHVAGQTFGEIEQYIQKRIKTTHSNTDAMVNISTYSTVQVNLVGDVVAPGVYNINALSTVKNLLIASHGVKKTGSLRDIMIKRDGKIVDSIDFYKLLQNGDESIGVILRSNDTIFVPKADKIISIDGEINEPAKFELKANETLADLVKYASGIKSNASKYGFLINRYIKNQNMKTIEVDYKDIKKFRLLDGDRVYVYGIDKVHKQSIYIYGNIVRPGEKELPKDRSLKKLLKDEIARLTLKGVFLEDTLFSYALIKSKTANLDKKITSFNLYDVLNSKKDIKLNNDDEIYIFNKYNSNITPYITIGGTPIRKSGKYRYYDGMKVSDVIIQAGTSSYFQEYSQVKITTYNTANFMPKITLISAKEAEDFLLSAYDDIEVYDYYKQNHIKMINISGEVHFPKRYSLNENMSLYDIVNIAGGFTEKAYKDNFEIIRYYIKDGKREKKLIVLHSEQLKTFMVEEYDEISIHSIPNWRDRKTVTIKGEVNFPGTYVIEEGDKLCNIIKRAGGYTDRAFLYAAVFTRESIRKLQSQKLEQSILDLKQKALLLSTGPTEFGQGNSKEDIVNITNVIDTIAIESKRLAPIGRVAIKLDKDLEVFVKSRSNIALKNQDTLTIPSKNDTVLVVGEVMSPTAIIYASNDVNFYLDNAGGLSQRAEEDNIYVVHANGSAQKVDKGWFSEANIHIVKAGDTIVVPQELVTTSAMQITKDISTIFYQFALTAAAMTAVGVF